MALLATLLQDPAPSPDRASISATALAVRLQTDWRTIARDRLTLDTSSLTYDGHGVTWQTLDAPYPDDITGTCQHSRLWRPSDPPPTDHVRHTVVAVTPDARPIGPDSAVLLGRVVAAMVALDPSARAVLWSPAQHAVHPEVLRVLTQEPGPEAALHLWVACNVGRDPGGRLTGHTVGLAPLGLMDVEIPETGHSPEQTLTQLRGLALHQIVNGPVIADGDTFGPDERQRILVRHAPSAFDPAVTVLQPQLAGGRRRGLFRRG